MFVHDTGLKDILVWKHLVSLMNTWPLASILWLIHMFIQRLMKFVGIGIDTKTTAHGLKGSLQSFRLIFVFTGLKNSLDYLKCLSAKLQRRDIDVFQTNTIIDNIKSEIQCLRDDIDIEFQRWYDEAKELASYVDTDGEMPRVSKVQCNRSNVHANTPLIYYKR